MGPVWESIAWTFIRETAGKAEKGDEKTRDTWYNLMRREFGLERLLNIAQEACERPKTTILFCFWFIYLFLLKSLSTILMRLKINAWIYLKNEQKTVRHTETVHGTNNC